MRFFASLRMTRIFALPSAIIFILSALILSTAATLPAQELPKPTYANSLVISIEHSALDSAEVDNIKSAFNFGLYAWLSLSHTTISPDLTWHANLNSADAGIQSFKDRVNALVAAGKAKKVKIHIVLTSGLTRGLNIYHEAKGEDVRNTQWFNDNKIAPDDKIGLPDAMDTQIFGTLSRYARKMQANLEAKSKAALAFLKQVMTDNPDVLIAVSGWGEAEFSDRRINHGQSLQDYFCDYSPFAIIEFRDWIQHTGQYDDAIGKYKGQGYAQGGTKYQGSAGLSNFNVGFGTSFSAWDLRYYNWSLSDDYDQIPEDYVNNDPRKIPFASYSHGNMKPTSGPNYIAGGFDPPRTMQPGDAFWDLWNLFRETMVHHFIFDVAKWASEAGIPADQWYSHQIPGDYLYGTKPSMPNKNARYYTSASPLWTANNLPYGSVGATIYDIKFPPDIYPAIFARTTQYILPDISAMSPNWAILEYDAETYPGAFSYTESTPLNILDQYMRLYGYRPHLINFWRWIDVGYDHTIKGMNKEIAIRDFVKKIRDKARSTDLNVVYGPPKVTGLTGQYGGSVGGAKFGDTIPISENRVMSPNFAAGIELRLTGKIWPDASWEWKEWGDFAYFEIYRGTSSDFPTDATHYLGKTSNYTYTDTTALIPSAFYYKMRAVNSAGAAGPSSDPVLVIAVTSPTALLSVDRRSLNFGAEAGKDGTSGQKIYIKNIGPAGTTLHWTASDDKTWINLDSMGGTGNGVLTVRVLPKTLAAGTYTGQVRVEDPQALLSPQLIDVTLKVNPAGSDTDPFGVFETPTNNTTVSGSIPVTGWVMDDVEVLRVEIKRNSHASDPKEAIGADDLVLIGDAIFVKGARPDIEQIYPSYPLNDRAGWGYMMLTNILPNKGNDTFDLYAYAYDGAGHKVLLGRKTIAGDNAQAVKPFGAIDSPAQGGTASGNQYINFGWALTPLPNMIPIDGSTIHVWVNGVDLGNPTYNQRRADIAAAFPDLRNSGGAVGYYFLDTTRYPIGVHTIAWSAEDDAQNADGIGSRYFVIENTGGAGAVAGGMNQIMSSLGAERRGDHTAIFGDMELSKAVIRFWDMSSLRVPEFSASESSAPVRVRIGFDVRKPAEVRSPGTDGVVRIEIKELERVAVSIGMDALDESPEKGRESKPGAKRPPSTKDNLLAARYAGFLKVGGELRPLPIGSTFDAARGIFYWMPGPGFIGEYELVFVRGGAKPTKTQVRIKISPKY